MFNNSYLFKNRVAKYIENKYKIANVKKNWRNLAEKVRHRLTKTGIDQFKEGIEFKKILELMRSLFINWDERNKFLAKRFIIRKWYMQVKRLKERDDKFDKAMTGVKIIGFMIPFFIIF